MIGSNLIHGRIYGRCSFLRHARVNRDLSSSKVFEKTRGEKRATTLLRIRIFTHQLPNQLRANASAFFHHLEGLETQYSLLQVIASHREAALKYQTEVKSPRRKRP